MDYQEAKYADIKDIDQQKDGWRCLGDYGWGFDRESYDLIKKITREDGWRIVKVVDANDNRTSGHDRDYYFISDKYKRFVGVPQQHWDSESFINYLERSIGKLKRFKVTLELIDKETGKKKGFKPTLIIYATDPEQVKEKFQKMLKTMSYQFDLKKYNYKIADIQYKI